MSRLEYQPDPNKEEAELPQPEETSGHHRLALPEQDEANEATLTSDNLAESGTRLQQVEDLLRNAPLLSVPIGFADRVVAALKGQDRTHPDYQDGMGIILGLVMAILIAVPLLGSVAYFIGRAVVSAEARNTLLADIEGIFTPLLSWIEGLSVSGVILVPLIVALLVGFSLLSGYVFWFVRSLIRTASSADDSNI